MIVVDTCVISYLVNESEFTPSAQKLFEYNPYWIYPPTWQDEYSNIVSKIAKEIKQPIDDAIKNFEFVVSQMSNNEKFVNRSKAIALSIKHGISAYDAQFVALAIDYNTILVTEDKELIRKCPQYAMSMQTYIRNAI